MIYELITHDGEMRQTNNLNILKRIMHNQYNNKEKNIIIKESITKNGYYLDKENKSLLHVFEKDRNENILQLYRKYIKK